MVPSNAILLFLLVLVSNLCTAAGRKAAAPTTVPIRGSQNLDLNCPSISYTFPPGTLRCESCLAVVSMLTFLIDAKFADPLDALEHVCDTLEEESVLKQRRNGLRYWYHEGMKRYLQGHDPAAQQKNKIFVDDNYDETLVTYHTKEERESLPCAHHFLKKFCSGLIETEADMIEGCIAEFTGTVSGKKSKKGAEQAIVVPVSDADVKSESSGRLGRDIALESLHHCLSRSVCSHADCEARMLAKSERDERIRFMKYQAVYGTNKFQYVADVDDENKLQPNPYAKGGAKARENEYLRMRPDEL